MRRRALWIAAALLLLAAGLLALVEPAPAPEPVRVEFPTAMRGAEHRREAQRQTLPPLPFAPPAPGTREPPRRDPFLAALPVGSDQPVVVFEANALRHSRLGELFVACALAEDPRAFSKLQAELGVDLLKDVDRLGFAGGAVVASGFFGQARWDRLVAEGAAVERYGDEGRIYRNGRSGEVVGVWRDQLVVFGAGDAAARQAIDQLEGRAEPPEPAWPEGLSYGEVYGVIPGAAVERLFSREAQPLGARLAAAASRVELHVDAMRDVAAVVRVEGRDAAALGEVARMLGGALAAGRVRSKASGDEPLTELLDAARVVEHGGALSLELALPAATLERWFEGCEGRAAARQAAPGAKAP